MRRARVAGGRREGEEGEGELEEKVGEDRKERKVLGRGAWRD